MKRLIVSGLVLLLVLVGATISAGCGGGNTDQAKKYVEQAEKIANERGSKNTEILTAWQTARQSTDTTAKDDAWKQAESIYGEIETLVKEEKAEYEKIEELNGVEDYAEYAGLKIEELNAYEEFLTATNDFQKKMHNGEFTSQQELEAASTAYQAEAEKLQDEFEQAETKAAQLKKDKNL